MSTTINLSTQKLKNAKSIADERTEGVYLMLSNLFGLLYQRKQSCKQILSSLKDEEVENLLQHIDDINLNIKELLKLD